MGRTQNSDHLPGLPYNNTHLVTYDCHHDSDGTSPAAALYDQELNRSAATGRGRGRPLNDVSDFMQRSVVGGKNGPVSCTLKRVVAETGFTEDPLFHALKQLECP